MSLGKAFLFARRELRAGTRGFRVFLLCLILGVAAIAGVGSVAATFLTGLAEEGRTLLGGDVEVETTLRPLNEAARAFLDEDARVSETVFMRSQAHADEQDARSLVSLKGVDAAYPLFGEIRLAPAISLAGAFEERGGRFGAVAEEALAARLGIGIGDPIRLGTETFELRAFLEQEPDRIQGGFQLGPRVLISLEGLGRTGLVTVGSLIDFNYRLAFPEGTTDAQISTWIDGARDRFPEQDWRLRSRANAAQGTQNFVGTAAVFLSLLGLAALAVGGIGVGQAVSSYMGSKTETIATLKTLGASGGLIFQTYLIQVLLMAMIAIAIGLALGAAAPFIMGAVLGDNLPVPARFGVYPDRLALGAGAGVLVSIAFALWPLGRAREVAPAALFRDLIDPSQLRPKRRYIIMSAVAGLGLIILTVLLSQNPVFALSFVGGVAGAVLILSLLARAVLWVLRKFGRPPRPALRLAYTNLVRPGGSTGRIMIALGTGLSLLVTVALTDANIQREVSEQVPAEAPAFFVVDIQPDQIDRFEEIAAETPGVGEVLKTANLRGRVVKINGMSPDDLDLGGGAWAARGDIGVTYAAELPANSEIAGGVWWPADYAGPPLMSMEAELARDFGLEIGDTITMNILGRDITAELASTRNIDFGPTLNFWFIMSPGVLEAAPHTFVATVDATVEAEEPFIAALARAFPNVTPIPVRETLTRLSGLLGQLSAGIRAGSALAIAAGVLVLTGAIAAGYRARLYDSMVLKVLGATRRRLLAVFLAEYGLLGVITAALAAAVGTLASYLLAAFVLNIGWVFMPGALAMIVSVVTLAVLGLGLAGTWQALGAKPSQVLRAGE